MRRVVSSVLLLASAAVFSGSAGMIVAILAARDAALWLGGWGVLLLAQPVVTIGLLCLVVGLAMRWMPDKQLQDAFGPAKLQYRLPGWALIGSGMFLMVDHTLKAAVFGMTAPVHLGIFAYLPVLDPKLPIGLAAMFLGLIVLRRAPRQSNSPSADTLRHAQAYRLAASAEHIYQAPLTQPVPRRM